MSVEPLATIVVGLVAAWLALLLLLFLVRPRDVGALELVRLVPDVLRLVRDLLRDPAVPRGVRAALVLLLAWLVSPIDLVPEFIPVLGPLDDVIVVGLVLRHLVRRAGPDVVQDHWRGDPRVLRTALRLAGLGLPE